MASGRAGSAGYGRRSPRAAAYQRRLVELVSRLQGCLPWLTPRERQTLTLRTGIGRRHWYDRRQVARILKVTLREEARIESAAVRELRDASEDGLCTSGSSSGFTLLSAAARETLALMGQVLRPAAGSGQATGALTAQSSHTAAGGRRSPAPGRRHNGKHSTAAKPGTRPHGLSSAALVHGGVQGLVILVAILAAIAAAALVYTLWSTHSDGAGVIGAWRASRAAASAPLAPVASSRAAPRAPTTPGANGASSGNGAATQSSEPFGDVIDAAVALHAARTLERMGDRERAEAAYRRADALGDAGAAFWLGSALARRGEEAGAEAAYRRADERGHAAAASNLGVLLERRGDVAGAEAAYRRASQRGDVNGAFNLGGLLAQRGDHIGAEAAYRKADRGGDAAAAYRLGELLEARGDRAGAQAAYSRADQRGQLKRSQVPLRR